MESSNKKEKPKHKKEKRKKKIKKQSIETISNEVQTLDLLNKELQISCLKYQRTKGNHVKRTK